MLEPSIGRNQIAIDPRNGVLFYKDGSGNLIKTTLAWAQDTYSSISTGDDVTISTNLVVQGNLTVNGTTVTLDTQTVTIEDNILILNANVTGEPNLNAGIEVERGSQPNVSIIWNELQDVWQFIGSDGAPHNIGSIEEGSVTLGLHTTGDYIENLVAGTGVTITNNSGEGSNPTIAIGQDVSTGATPTFARVIAPLTGNVIGNVTGNVTGNVIGNVTGDVTGDITGQVSDISNHGISDLSDVVINDPATGDFLRYNGTDWINDPVNLTTDTVGDYVAKLAAGTGITITNNSGEGSTPNISFSGSIDNITDVVITSAQNGQILQYNGTAWVNEVRPSSEPIGHENKADSVISFDEGSRQFSISPTSTSYTVWCTGKRYVKTTTESVTIPDTSGLYYIYFNSSGSLAYKTTYFTWDQDTPTAYIYWNDVDNKAYFFADERHGVTLDWATHEYLHRTRGAAIAGGFGVNNYTITGDGSIDADAKIDIANGTFFDEDLQVDIEHSSSPTVNTWQQRLQSGAYIPVFYRTNSAWKKDTATQFPVRTNGSRAQYNLYSGGTWSAAEIDNSKYGVMFLVATNNLNEPILAIMGQQQFTDQGSAEASTWDDLDLDGFPVFEFRPLYKIVIQTANAYSNTPKTKFVNLSDLRQVISAGAGSSASAVSDHGLMTGLQDDDHTQYLLADGTRTAASLTVSGAVTASSLILDGIEIDAATPSDTNVLKYDASLNKYIPGVASTVASLDDLTDVVISSATPNQVLKYDGSNWVNAISPSSVEGTTYFSTIGNGVDSTFTITHNLSTRDVVVSFTETTSPYASFNTLWEATTLNAITVYFETPPALNAIRVSIYAAVSGVAITTDLDSLNDVAISGLANGDFLRYNGSAWINDPVNLSTDTVGDYVQSLVAGAGVTINNNTGEATTPTISIGQDVTSSATPTFGALNVNGGILSTGLSVTGSTSLGQTTIYSVEIDPSGATNGNSLVYSGGKFIAQTITATADTRDIEIKLAMDVG